MINHLGLKSPYFFTINYIKMKQTINVYQFRDAFMNLRPKNFTYEGLTVLFDWFEELEASTDTEIELDVIAICCDYTQSTIKDALNCYGLDSIEDLEYETIVITVNDDEIIYRNY